MLLAAWRVLVGLKYSHQQHFNDPSFEETYAPLKLNHLTGSAPNTPTQILLRFRFLQSPLGPLVHCPLVLACTVPTCRLPFPK